MKKLLLGAAFMLGAITVNAQDGPKVPRSVRSKG